MAERKGDRKRDRMRDRKKKEQESAEAISRLKNNYFRFQSSINAGRTSFIFCIDR